MQFQYNHCDAAECACPKGRNYSKDSGDWEIIKCKFCGANGAHAKCRNGDIEKTLDCENCVKNAFSIQEMGSRCSQNIDNKISGCENNDSTSTNNEMQNYRLTNFFDTADFEAKPPPFPWLVWDFVKMLWLLFLQFDWTPLVENIKVHYYYDTRIQIK